MSDGTLRALGVLVPEFQSRVEDVPSALLAGIEEPEVAPHPAAVGALLDALREARRSTQVRVTTHSPDLLDLASLETGLLLVIYADRGATQLHRSTKPAAKPFVKASTRRASSFGWTSCVVSRAASFRTSSHCGERSWYWPWAILQPLF